MIDLGTAAGVAAGGTFASLALAAIGRIIARRFARDGVEFAKDRTEVDVMNMLREDNKQLRADLKEATDKNNASQHLLGKLNATVESLTDKILQAKSDALEQVEQSRRQAEITAMEVKRAVEASEARNLAFQAAMRAAQNQVVEKVSLVADKVNLNTELVMKNTELTEQASIDARAAFESSNTVNAKLLHIGVEMKDGRPLEPSAEEVVKHMEQKNANK